LTAGRGAEKRGGGRVAAKKRGTLEKSGSLP